MLLQGTAAPWDKRPLPGPEATPLPLTAISSLPPGAMRVLAVGDIGLCGSPGVGATGALVASIPDAIVLPLGDIAYPKGSDEDFERCFDPAWGHARDRSWPVAGNHEYDTPDASGYFAYYGESGGTPAQPWRAMQAGAWRVYLLDSECGQNAPCDADAQLAWFTADLAAHPTACLLATWHRPRHSSGPHGSNRSVDALWRAFAAAGGDVILAGHDHLYERFVPLDADSQPDPQGMRSFVVGTGGWQLYHIRSAVAGSEIRADASFGVLELALRPDGYDWAFRAALGEPFEDLGSGAC